MEKEKKQKDTARGIFGLVIISYFVFRWASGPDHAVTARASASGASEAGHSQARGTVEEPCQKVEHLFGAGSKLSDIQRKEKWKDYEGKTFEWKVEVSEVSEEILGSGYRLQLKCVPSKSFVQDVVLSVGADKKDWLMKLQKGGIYNLKGLLVSYSVLGLEAQLVE